MVPRFQSTITPQVTDRALLRMYDVPGCTIFWISSMLFLAEILTTQLPG